MVNLLPTNDFKHVLREHGRRVGVIALALIALSTVFLSLFAIPSAIVTWSGAGGFDQQLEATKTLVTLQRKQGGGDTLTDLSTRAELLAAVLAQPTPSSILQDIVPRIPSGVSVRQFSYAPTDEGVSVTLLGTAATRNALIEFGANLRVSPFFSRVDVPISSLARSEDIEFTLTISLKNTDEIAQSLNTQEKTDEPETVPVESEL